MLQNYTKSGPRFTQSGLEIVSWEDLLKEDEQSKIRRGPTNTRKNCDC